MPYNLAATWNWRPGVLLFFAVIALLYIFGVVRVNAKHWRDAQVPNIHVARIIAFFVGWLIAVLILVSPLDTIGRTQIFFIHIAQIILLSTISVPLVLVGCPEPLLRPALNIAGIREITKLVTGPIVASILFNFSFIIWNSPRIYNAASVNGALYDTMMVWFFVVSLINWWPLLGSVPQFRTISYPVQMLYAFFDGLPLDIYAFILVYSGTTLFTNYTIPAQLNLTRFGDQTVGGALLLVPGVVDLIVMTPYFFLWLRQTEQKTRLADEIRQQELDDEYWYGDEDYEEEEEEEEHHGRTYPSA
jgi:cytochrome c oxidase assembly factor CtaG